MMKTVLVFSVEALGFLSENTTCTCITIVPIACVSHAHDIIVRT